MRAERKRKGRSQVGERVSVAYMEEKKMMMAHAIKLGTTGKKRVRLRCIIRACSVHGAAVSG